MVVTSQQLRDKVEAEKGKQLGLLEVGLEEDIDRVINNSRDLLILSNPPKSVNISRSSLSKTTWIGDYGYLDCQYHARDEAREAIERVIRKYQPDWNIQVRYKDWSLYPVRITISRQDPPQNEPKSQTA